MSYQYSDRCWRFKITSVEIEEKWVAAKDYIGMSKELLLNDINNPKSIPEVERQGIELPSIMI